MSQRTKAKGAEVLQPRGQATGRVVPRRADTRYKILGIKKLPRLWLQGGVQLGRVMEKLNGVTDWGSAKAERDHRWSAGKWSAVPHFYPYRTPQFAFKRPYALNMRCMHQAYIKHIYTPTRIYRGS